ncbi:MAG: DMT family transporter, partial [Sphingomonadaceae bacterium]
MHYQRSLYPIRFRLGRPIAQSVSSKRIALPMGISMPRRPFPMLPQDHATLAILARVVAGVFMAIMSAFAKAAGNAGAEPGEILFFRSALAMPVVLLWVLMGPGIAALRTTRPKAHLLRAIIGLTSMTLMFYALSLLPLAEAITIFFIAPLMATCLAALFLGDRVGIHRWMAIGVGFLGVIIVMQPGANSPDISMFGVGMAVLAALLMAAVTITLRQLGTTENEAATVFWFTLIGTTIMGCAYPIFYHPHEPFTWLLLAGVGISGAVIQIATTLSLRLAPVSLTASFDYAQLFWATLIGWLIWADLPSLSTVLGGIMIAGAGLYTFYRERL